MPKVEFVTQSSRDPDNYAATTERLINFYPEPTPDGSLAQFSLKSVLGTEEWINIDGTFVRAFDVVGGVAYAVLNGQLYELSAGGSVSDLGGIPDSKETNIAGHGDAVTLCAGGQYHVWDGDTLTRPADGAFSDMGGVEYIGGYTVITEADGIRFQWSALGDPKELPGLNFASAEARDDDLLRPLAINGNLWLFGDRSIEIWTRTGEAAENAFARLGGAVVERGLKAFGLVTKIPGGAFFVGNDGVCYLASGTDIEPISRVGVETAIAEADPTACFYYQDEGHKFCVIRFSDRPAWVYDLSTGFWHERSFNGGPWNGTAAAEAYGAWRLATIGGAFHEMKRNNVDEGAELRRVAVSRPLYMDGRHFRVPRVELLGRIGRADIGRTPKVMFRFSRDGGNTWGNVLSRSMGDLGEYDRRVTVRSLGRVKMIAAEVAITEPADITLLSAMNVEVE